MQNIGSFFLQLEDLQPYGHGLVRPECIIAYPDGRLVVSNMPNGALQIFPDGTQERLGSIDGVPNGIAADRKENLIVTDIANGRVWEISPRGEQLLLLEEIHGSPLGAANFALLGPDNAIWISVSTRAAHRSESLASPRPDGYIVRINEGQARIVAEGFLFTNEIRFDSTGNYLYVAETTGGRVRRMSVAADGSLGAPEQYGPDPLFKGARVDGIAFDSAGNLWLTEISRNGIYVIQPDGTTHCVIEDLQGIRLRVPTSITFAGPNLQTAYVGSLAADHLLRFTAPIPGVPQQHWVASRAELFDQPGSYRF